MGTDVVPVNDALRATSTIQIDFGLLSMVRTHIFLRAPNITR